MARLRNKYLHVPVDAVLHPASASAQEAATEQKDKAARALADERRRGYVERRQREAESKAVQQRAREQQVREWLAKVVKQSRERLAGARRVVGGSVARVRWRAEKQTAEPRDTFDFTSYRILAAAALVVGMLGGWTISEGLYAASVYNNHVLVASLFSADRALYVGTILVLMTKLTIRLEIAPLSSVFITLYVIFFLTTFVRNAVGSDLFLVSVLSITAQVVLLWLTVATNFGLRKDKNMLTVAIVTGAMQGLVGYVFHDILLPDQPFRSRTH
jgi:hypothetical protein